MVRGAPQLVVMKASNVGPEAATQVEWNRQNEHILASSHASDVLIWDRRVRLPKFLRCQSKTSAERIHTDFQDPRTHCQDLRYRLVA